MALERAIRSPDLRRQLGEAAEETVRSRFDHHASIGQLASLFGQEWRRAA
jgi:hypothetical protein